MSQRGACNKTLNVTRQIEEDLDVESDIRCVSFGIMVHTWLPSNTVVAPAFGGKGLTWRSASEDWNETWAAVDQN